MLRIRLQRTGRKNLPTYRIVVAEKSQAVKKKYVDLLGHYLPSQNPKVLEIDQEKVKAWISKGAIPTDTVASLCKRLGMQDMDKYLDPRNKKRKKKKEPAEAPTPAPAAASAPTESAPVVEETPVEEPTPEVVAETPTEESTPEVAETPAEEVVEEAPVETPAPEATEEAPTEEAPKEEEKTE